MKHLSNHHIFKLCMVLPAVISLCSFILSPHIYDMISEFRTPSFMPDIHSLFFFMLVFSIFFGISAYYFILSSGRYTAHILKFYAASCFFLFFWPILLFEYQLLFFAFVWTIMLNLINCYLFFMLCALNLKSTISLIPYLLWCLFLCCFTLNFLILN